MCATQMSSLDVRELNQVQINVLNMKPCFSEKNINLGNRTRGNGPIYTASQPIGALKAHVDILD